MWGGYKYTYEKYFYHKLEKGKHIGTIKGFPMQRGNWCTQLKIGYGASITKANLRKNLLSNESKQASHQRISDDERKLVQFGTEDASTKFSKGKESEVVQYLGIASDEPIRIARHKDKKGILLPLVEIGWTEADAKQWCIDNDLLSPIYTESDRGGCWFCHNQSIDQLRKLRHNYPNLWELLMKWDNDSPTTFRADGHTVHDFDRRFQAEDEGYDLSKFKWSELDHLQINIFQMFDENGDYIYRSDL